MEEGSEKKNEEDNENRANLDKAEQQAESLSLSLSFTPPIPEDNDKGNGRADEASEASISEHLTSNGDSVENDRSFQEIVINNQLNPFSSLPSVEHVSQEQRPESFLSENESSIISLNYLEMFNKQQDDTNNVKSLLEEILNNDQFESDDDTVENSHEQSFNVFQNLDLEDKSLTKLKEKRFSMNENFYDGNFEIPSARSRHSESDKKVQNLEEILSVKDTTIAALNSEIESFKEASSNTLSTVSATEYKQLQEECNAKLLECNSILIYKNDLIEQLSEALEQSVCERKELMSQIESFKTDIIFLQEKLKETSQMLDEHNCEKTENKNDDVDNVQEITHDHFAQEALSAAEKIDRSLEASNTELIDKLKNEIEHLKSKVNSDKVEYESEITRLRDLLSSVKCGTTEIMELKNELEAKHSQEMEELRTYFEKKCAELEKNYSEEIFSQHSRKLSGASSEGDLNSEMLFSNQPGPAGDNLGFCESVTKSDMTKLKDDLNTILDKLNQHDLENMTDDEFNLLKSEISKYNFKHLLKAEVDDRVNIIQNKYLDEISNLKYQLDEISRQRLSICANQEVGSSGEFEITDIIQSYERRLQEQITLAKVDIISALECQIQRLVSNEAEDEEWPSELLILRDRFTDRYELKIQEMKEEHEQEVERIKEEHLKVLNGALERARRRSLRDNESLSKGEIELLRDRDNLKKQVSSLRNLLGELVKYFTQCEDELNNTLVDELLKQGIDKNLNQTEEELNLNESSATNSSSSFPNVTRVHLAPNFNDLITMLETQVEDEDSKDISLELKTELGKCLETLRLEANAILALTTNLPNKAQNEQLNKSTSLEDKVSSLTRQLINETQLKDKYRIELNEAISLIDTIEKEKNNIESQLEAVIEKENIMEKDLAQAKAKIAELIENGHKEIVSEGYGEEGNMTLQGLDDTMSLLADLQEKARNMLSQSRTTADPKLLTMIEELCRVSEKIKEESKKDRSDLLQQVKVHKSPINSGKKVEAADKKYKTTQKFLEEQAMEREQERDEAQNKIERLKERLKERDKDRANCEMISSERENGFCQRSCRELAVNQIVQLEEQIQQMTVQLEEESRKLREVDLERAEAIEKIKILRDIIRELENQNEAKSAQILEYLEAIEKLECIITQQNGSLEELKQINSVANISDVQELRRHIESLEGELNQLRIDSELAGTEGVLKQIKLQITEFEGIIEKKTKDLEALHSTGTSCSSPSEDMSVRDLVKPQIMNQVVLEECEIPLQQLARLKEKLLRHSRAEDAAMKRIKDLEMQVCSIKNEIEEAENEKEYMRKQVQEQLVLISDLQIRLDEQRIRAEHIEKQSNTSLESRIYDLQNEITTLQEKIRNKEKTIHHQQVSLEEIQKRLNKAESEMCSPKDDELLIEMQKELEELRLENTNLKQKMSTDASMVPNLVDNIISDKNKDIEKLKGQLNETQRILDGYTSLNFDKKDLQTLVNLRNSGTTLQDIICFLDLTNPEQMRRNASRNETPPELNLLLKKSPDETLLDANSDPEISAIPKEGVHHTMGAPLGKQNSTEMHKSMDKKVHFEDIEILQNELENRDKIIKEYGDRLRALSELESKIEKLQENLDRTEKALSAASEKFEKEQQEVIEREKKLKVELAEKKLHLDEKEKCISSLEKDSKRKDDMCLKLSKEKRDLEREIMLFKKDSFENLERVLNLKNAAIEELKEQLECYKSSSQNVKYEIEEKTSEIQKLLNEIKTLRNSQKELQENLEYEQESTAKLSKEVENNQLAINDLQEEIERLKREASARRTQLKKLESTLQQRDKFISEYQLEERNWKSVLASKDREISELYAELAKQKNEIIELQEKISNLRSGDKDKKIEELTREVNHLQDLVGEKDKIINQITEDTRKVHVNLVTIQNTMRESGNIIDLSNKLKEKQKENASLLEEIHDLKVKLMNYETLNMATSVDEITGQLKRELDYSAQIDSNILTALSDQSLGSISETQDVETYKKIISKARKQNRRLLEAKQLLEKEKTEFETKCCDLQGQVDSLGNLLEKERMTLEQTLLEDAKLIEQLRIKLNAALDAEEQFGRVLEEEKATRAKLEIELIELKKRTEKSLSSDSTKYKQPPTRETFEVVELKKDLSKLQEEHKKLSENINELENIKQELEANNRYLNDMLSVEAGRNKALETKTEKLLDNERELTAQLLFKKLELEEKAKEIDRFKLLNNELEEANEHLKKQKAEMKKLRAEMAPNAESSYVPEALQAKIAELTNKARESSRLLERLEMEKRMAEEKLAEANGRRDLPFHDLLERSDYLFAKTLKLESVRKALIWQKRYLIDYLESHKKFCVVAALPTLPRLVQHRRNPKRTFKAAVTVIISISRMKYLVRRWHNGLRYARKINQRHFNIPQDPSTVNFHVGQPVSTNPFRVDVNNDVPWSGSSPPSKEQHGRGRFTIGSAVVRNEDLTPLRAPQLLAQFAERFDQIQEKLGVALESNQT